MSHPITPENVTRAELSNGIVILVKENHTNASVTLRGRLRAGAMYETDAVAGLADFTASSLQRGTKKYTFQQLNELYDSVGMSFGVGSGTETASFGGKSLTEDFESLLGIAEQVLREPADRGGFQLRRGGPGRELLGMHAFQLRKQLDLAREQRL